MKKIFVYKSILFMCFIQACNSSSAPVTTAGDSTTNDSAYDRSTATERIEKNGVKKENINHENTKEENVNNQNAQRENTNNESSQREDTNNENINDENTKIENATTHNTIQQEDLNNHNRVHLNANEVPDAVISALHTRYPTVYKVNWVVSGTRKKTLYIAHWQAHKNKMMAVFAEDGMFIREKQNE